ncbi:cornifelin homolog B-like [Trematomus bernacchii]|uniref:cornifelin homolog B-like n=1 Tax=Trematomus bernacchii TaxID=40690 RepID=UPI00146DA3E9|nr:cornifelin homolog B-like [Trematomus bernacchii]
MHFSADTGCNRTYDSELSQHTNTQKAIMTSKMVNSQPQCVMDTRDSDEWGSGICDCFQNVPECCFAFWCCPCFACKTTKTYGQGLCLPLLDMSCCVPPVTMSMRVSMRERYALQDTMFRDCLFATFCTACSWCQMSREMRRRNH